jgi:hypothetical protein
VRAAIRRPYHFCARPRPNHIDALVIPFCGTLSHRTQPLEDEMNRTSLLIGVCLAAITAVACSGSSKKLDLGGQCVQNSDCNNPLSCKFATCHQQCTQSRDCSAGMRCVIVDGSGICQTAAESVCGAKCVAPMVCNPVDNSCRGACTTSANCLTSQTCVGTFCVDNTELANKDGSAGAGVGVACTLTSDCGSSLLCKFGTCHQACTSSTDCAGGGRCVTANGVAVCQLPTESACSASRTCAAGLACRAVDSTCRSACSISSNCLNGQTCEGTVCVEISENIPGNDGSAGAGGAGGRADAGAAGAGGAGGRVDAAAAGAGGGSLGGSDAGVDVPVTSPGDAAGSDGSGGTAGTAGGSTGGSAGRTGSGGQTGNSCPSPQTQFGFIAEGDSNSNFQSGLGVRTADELLIFNGYLGPDPSPAADAGSPSKVSYVYVQAFDPGSGESKGPAIPFFKAANAPFNGSNVMLNAAAIAPSGEIILLYFMQADAVNIATFAAFLSKSTTDAGVGGLQVGRIVQVEVSTLGGQPDCIWSVASKAFVCSWQYQTSGGWPVKVRKFLPDGRSAGGDTDNVPTDTPSSTTRNYGEVGVSGNLFGVAYTGWADGLPKLTVMDKLGNQVGSYVELNPGASAWVTVAGTSAGFVTFYDQAGVAATLVPVDSSGKVAATSADAGVVLQGFHFSGTKAASAGRAINDDVGGMGGVGLALLYNDGVAFAYVSADGLTHVGPGTVISHSRATGDYMNITNFAGSFGVSLYSANAHSTQMAATGCTP